jgi:hypothetical protein
MGGSDEAGTLIENPHDITGGGIPAIGDVARKNPGMTGRKTSRALS